MVNVARRPLRFTRPRGVVLALVVSILLMGALPASAATSPIGIYTQNSVFRGDCWATSWSQSPATQCRHWSSSLQTGLPQDTYLQGDFCMNYGDGAREMNQASTVDFSSLFGFQVPTSAYQHVDPVTGTSCATTGTSSRYGMVVRGTQANGYCVATNCGIMHLLNWPTPAVRPFQNGRSLAFGVNFGVLTDNVGYYGAQSVWHGYLCPALQDTSTSQGFLLCEETWRSDAGADAVCHEQGSFYGYGYCLSGGKVTAVMAPGGLGFREFIGPDPGGYYGMVWTRPQPGTQLATSTAAKFRSSNVGGAQTYAASVSPSQLLTVIAMFNFALHIDQNNGYYRNVRPLSTALGNYALTSLQVGVEGNAVGRSTSAMIGATSSGLFATSQ